MSNEKNTRPSMTRIVHHTHSSTTARLQTTLTTQILKTPCDHPVKHLYKPRYTVQ